MRKLLLVLAALALGALGVNGLLTADPSSQTDFVVAGLELIGAIVLIGLAFVLGRGSDSATPDAAPDDGDRAEVIGRLQRHTESLRLAEETADGGALDSAPAECADAQLGETAPADDRDPHREDTAGGPSAAERASEEEGPAGAPSATLDAGRPAGESGPGSPANLPVRLPALMLLNVGGSAKPADIESAPPLGRREDVLARLRDIVPDLEIDAEGRARHAGPDHAIRLDLGGADEVHTVVVDAAGRTGISLVRWFLESTGWRAFVPKLGRFIEPDALDGLAIREE